MGDLLTGISTRIAERWLSLLVLPGALYVATLTAADTLGHTHPFDVGRLAHRLDHLASAAQAHAPGGLAVALLALLLAAAASGMAAQALGSLTERLWFAAGWQGWPVPVRRLAHDQVERRRRRWRRASAVYHQRLQQDAADHARAHATGHGAAPATGAPRAAAHREVVRIAVEEPERPTWMGDRLHAVAVRLDRELGLDLATVWPHLWLMAPDATRSEITAAREDLSRSANLAGWGLLYLAAGILWWPGLLIGAGTLVTAWHHARAATSSYALLVDAAARLHAADLARQHGLEHHGPFTFRTGLTLSSLLQGRGHHSPHRPDT